MYTLYNAGEPKQKTQLVNTHSHIFTGDCVPPWLAKAIVPWPFYYLLHVGIIVSIFRWWYSNDYSPYKWQFKPWYKKFMKGLYLLKMSLKRYGILRILKLVTGSIIFISICFGLYDWKLKELLSGHKRIVEKADSLREWFSSNHLLIITNSWWVKAILLIILLVFFPAGKNLLLFVLKQMGSFIKFLPGKHTTELLKRYLTIVRFARYERQKDIFKKLTNQYPQKSGIVVLPMDMEFMDAGKPYKKYHEQMEELSGLKEKNAASIFPFVFVDPRRKMAGDKIFFDYEHANGNVTLKECFIKEYIEIKKFSGLKIYPALGYYPFDEALLPLWKYAADNNIPITTHCIRGVIYYRGSKKKEWDFHPIFKQAMGKEKEQNGTGDDDTAEDVEGCYEPLLLPQIKNSGFQENFTHPLNYLCLLDEALLRQVVGKAKNGNIKELFGYTNENTPLKYNLHNLKICFGHFGGDDEWRRFFDKDRDNYGSQLAQHPTRGIKFLTDKDEKPTPGRYEQIWKFADWYSIICSLMLQYPNVYADISYILHSDAEILPLLKQTLQNENLKTKVLYGTDFYVVRNHKSDKNMLSDMQGGLTENDFDCIARENPKVFLNIS